MYVQYIVLDALWDDVQQARHIVHQQSVDTLTQTGLQWLTMLVSILFVGLYKPTVTPHFPLCEHCFSAFFHLQLPNTVRVSIVITQT